VGVGGQHHDPAALRPRKTQCPLYRRLGGPQSRSGQVRKISPPSELDPWTVEPVASRYTDWANPTHLYTKRAVPSTILSFLHQIILITLREFESAKHNAPFYSILTENSF